MSQLIQAMTLLRTIFDKYAGKEGAKDTLTKKELAELLRTELECEPECQSKAEVDKFFRMLDNDSDGVISFEEYVTFVAAITVMLCLERGCVNFYLNTFVSVLSSQIPLFHPLDLHKFSYKFATMSQLIQAMDLLRTIFDKYAREEGAKDTLTKKELAELLRKEFSVAGPQSKAEIDTFFGMLDNDGDGVVSFEEYVSFVAALTVISTSK
ncbi:uncharacterized protein LOC144518958 [Sander vitreus]